jgi:hypothetical protein
MLRDRWQREHLTISKDFRGLELFEEAELLELSDLMLSSLEFLCFWIGIGLGLIGLPPARV